MAELARAGGAELPESLLAPAGDAEDEAAAEAAAEGMVACAPQRAILLRGAAQRPSPVGPSQAVEQAVASYSGLAGAMYTPQFASPLLRPLGRTPLPALRWQAMMGEEALPAGRVVMPAPMPAELVAALRRQVGRYHHGKPDSGKADAGEAPGSVPPSYAAQLKADPKQPELWALAAMERAGWHHDGSKDSMDRLEAGLKVCHATRAAIAPSMCVSL